MHDIERHRNPIAKRFVCSLIAFLLVGWTVSPTVFVSAEDTPPEWKAGVASVTITPEQPMWMAGYAARNKPSEGKVHDLHAKALALEDAQGTRLVIVTMDLLGVTRDMRDSVEVEAKRLYGLPPEGLLMNASHTHCGPELRADAAEISGVSPEYVERIKEYVPVLQEKIVRIIGESLANLAPAELAYSHGRAGFAMNRRQPTEHGVENRPYPDGPVDHDVPMLRVDKPGGELRAVLYGYACHNTTLDFYQFCGDYAGFSQQYVEESHPGVTALFMIGCGGDQNPQPRGIPDPARFRRLQNPSDAVPYRIPRGAVELAEQHGRALANGVEAALHSYPRMVHAPLRAAMDTVALDFAKTPTKEDLEKQAQSPGKYERDHARMLLEELEKTGKIRISYPYLAQTIRFGDDLTLVALSGEATVDYSLRLKKELAGAPVWVAGYCNDVFGYLASRRVLEEGGYEAVGSTGFYGLPGGFALSVEEAVVGKVKDEIRRMKDEG